MEMYVIDFEASSLNTNIAKPYQLAALKYDDDMIKWGIESWYFATDKEVPHVVQQITHLTKDIVNHRSNGLTFSEQYQNFRHVLRPGNVLIGHNINGYDKKLLMNLLSREGLPSLSYVTTVDTMTQSKYYPFVKNKSGRISKDNALIDLAESRELNIENLKTMICSILLEMGFSKEECHSHNAIYDVYAQALLYHFGKVGLPKELQTK